MKRNNVLTIMSLLSIILLSLHLTDDIVYGTDRSPASNVVAIAVLVIWLYGTLVLAERRSGYAIMLLGSVAGMVVFTVHVSRAGGLPAGSGDGIAKVGARTRVSDETLDQCLERDADGSAGIRNQAYRREPRQRVDFQ